MDKPKNIINSHSKEEQFKLILDTGNNASLFNKRLISKEMKNHVHNTKAKINFPLLDVMEELRIFYMGSKPLNGLIVEVDQICVIVCRLRTNSGNGFKTLGDISLSVEFDCSH
ncbi:hypothetical protein ACTFIW_000844 [Dictyostelium discoideum]